VVYGTLLADGVVRGGLAKDWSPSETQTSLAEALADEQRHRG
jgi:hypothetical protein